MTKGSGELSWQEKIRLVSQVQGLKGEELEDFLKREGLNEALLRDWELSIRGALNKRGRKPTRHPVYEKRVKAIEKELRRKNKDLKEARALLALQKKIQEIWGDGEEGMR